jgi:hypothetical protein
MHDVLISYSSKDKAIADAVCNRLESEGIRVWIAPRDIGAGESYPTAIVEGIKNCSIIVMLFTANSNQSNWVPREIERGVNYGKIILPFKIEDAQPVHGDIELCTCTQHWMDAISPPLEANIARLVETVQKLLDKSGDAEAGYLRQAYSKLSPLGQFYQLADRWAKNNHAYFVLESLNEEQKSILRNAPKTIEVDNMNVQLFMLEASLHYGGDYIYWGRRIADKEALARHLVKMLSITYIRPRYRALYLMQQVEKDILKPELEARGLNQNAGLMQLIDKYVYTGKFKDYIIKVSESKDHEVARRAKTVLFEINRYDGSGDGIDVFPEL